MDATATPERSAEELRRENEQLAARNRELVETIDAIRRGEVDAIVVAEGDRQQVYALEGADRPYRVLVERIQEGALTLTTEGTILFANAAFARMLGRPLSSVQGTLLADHVAPRDRERFAALLAEARTAACRGDVSLCAGAGTARAALSLTPIEAEGRPTISVVVTDRRRDYARLRLQGRMLDSVVDAVTAVDPGGTIIYWNEAAERLYGWTAAERVGLSFDETLDPDMSAEDARRSFEELLAGETWSGEYLARHRDGRRFPVHAARAPVFDEDGALIAIIGTSQDISERKRAEEALRESEEQLRSVLENSMDAIVLTDPESGGRILAANPAACRLLGWAEEELVGLDRNAIVDLADPRLATLMRERARDGAAGTELTYRRRDGSTFPGEVTTALFTDGLGRVRAVSIIRDVSERKEAELGLARYAEQLKQSNEELQRFAYVASHDLQEPLRSIVSFSQLLEKRYRGKLDADADEFIGFIIEGGTRMQRLIRDLLQVSRVETGAKPLAPTDATAVVNDAVRSIDAALCEAGATVTIGDLPAVMADAAQLEQVFANLIGNAVKYRHPDRLPAIRIEGRRLDGMVEFAVADNGIGIEEEYFDRIFEMFRRLHTHDQYEGTGIGLAVVKRIVERHGGTVRVESVLGEGTTFLFTLPAA